MVEEQLIENVSFLEKQKKGKARSKQFGRVEIPQEAFIGVSKNFIKKNNWRDG
jgi:translation elongation factor EF-4